jgi:RNA polymerase sigma-70 factor (ECF subfamily)
MESAAASMNTTSLSLLERLKHAKPDAVEWCRLRDIYSPMIRHWLSRSPQLRHDLDDLTQEVLVVLVRELPSFERRQDGSFRAWLRQLTVNRVWAFCKTRRRQPLATGGPQTDQLLAGLADPTSDLARQWDQDHDRHVFQKLLTIVEGDFEPGTWQAFTRFAVEGRPAAQVAGKLGITESAVVQAKFRILKRLREEAGELLD